MRKGSALDCHSLCPSARNGSYECDDECKEMHGQLHEDAKYSGTELEHQDLRADGMAFRNEYAREVAILCHRETPPMRDAAIPWRTDSYTTLALL
jgi:hypothetical protein